MHNRNVRNKLYVCVLKNDYVIISRVYLFMKRREEFFGICNKNVIKHMNHEREQLQHSISRFDEIMNKTFILHWNTAHFLLISINVFRSSQTEWRLSRLNVSQFIHIDDNVSQSFEKNILRFECNEAIHVSF